MKRKIMSLEIQLKGVRKAIQSPRTPPHLKKSLRRRADVLKKKLSDKKSPGFFERLGF
jgi:hypothetical protein